MSGEVTEGFHSYSEHDLDETLTCRRCGKTRLEIVADKSGKGPCLVYARRLGRRGRRLLAATALILPMWVVLAFMLVLPFTGPITGERVRPLLLAAMALILFYTLTFPAVTRILKRIK